MRRILSLVAITIAIAITARTLDAQVRTGSSPEISDYRTSPSPTVRLTAGRSCPVVLGTGDRGLPEGFREIYSATRLANGNLAVLDAKAQTLLFFDETGKLLARAGGHGRGPGEFTSILPAVYPYRGDSVLVDDPMVGMLHVFDHNGKHGRSTRLPVPPPRVGRPTLVGASIEDGTTIWRKIPVRPIQNGPRVVRDSITLVWRDPVGRDRAVSPATLDAFLALDITVTAIPSRSGPGVQAGRVSVQGAAPGPVARVLAPRGSQTATLAVRGQWVYHFEEANDAVAIYRPDGSIARRILLPALDPKLRTGPEKLHPATAAQMLELHADDLGRVWVEVARATVESDRLWWVFDHDGRRVASVTTPPRTETILEVSEKYVLTRRTDADGVQTVAYCPVSPGR